jgi:hypothetical protein
MVKSAADGLGGLDIIIANAAWTRFEDKFGDLENGLTDEEWDKVPRHIAALDPVADFGSAGPRMSCITCS